MGRAREWLERLGPVVRLAWLAVGGIAIFGCPRARVARAAVAVAAGAILSVALSSAMAGPASAQMTRVGPLVLSGTVIARSRHPVALAARAGHVVYAVHDFAAGGWVLLDQTAVAVRRLPFPAERTRPDPSLGVGRDGHLLVVWADRPGSHGRDFRLLIGDLTTDRLRAVPGTAGALRGSVSGSRVVFVRADADHVHRLYETTPGGGQLRRLALPVRMTEYTPHSGPPRPAYLIIRWLVVEGDTVAYVLDYRTSDATARSEVWIDRPDGTAHLVAVEGTGGAASGFREFFAPRVYSGDLVVFAEQRDAGNSGDTVQRFGFNGTLLGSATIGLTDTDTYQLSSATWDAGHLYYSLSPYQGNGCQPALAPIRGATCPVLDSARLRL